MRCSRERISWLDEKFQGWLDSNGPLCPSAARSSLPARRKPALLMLAGIAACLATFVPLNSKPAAPVAQTVAEAPADPVLTATDGMAALNK